MEGRHHLIPHGVGPDGVLSGQGSTAEQDEEQDEVGEPGGIDNAVTQDTDPGGDRLGGWKLREAGGQALLTNFCPIEGRRIHLLSPSRLGGSMTLQLCDALAGHA